MNQILGYGEKNLTNVLKANARHDNVDIHVPICQGNVSSMQLKRWSKSSQ